MKQSKTRLALVLVADGATPYQAAKSMGLAPSTIYKALAKRREREARGVCQHCGQTLPKRS
jgi:hypothetical protein